MLRKNLTSDYKRKKGQAAIVYIIFAIIVLVIFSVLGISLFKVQKEVNDDIQADNDMSPEAKEISQESTTNFPKWADGAFLTLTVFMWILMLVMAYFSSSHPILFGATIVLMSFLIFAGAVLSNFHYEFVNEDDLVIEKSYFPITNYCMDRLPLFLLVMGFSVLIVSFAKPQ